MNSFRSAASDGSHRFVAVGGQPKCLIGIDLSWEVADEHPDREIFVDNQHDRRAFLVAEWFAARQGGISTCGSVEPGLELLDQIPSNEPP